MLIGIHNIIMYKGGGGTAAQLESLQMSQVP
jgi:hypothetical protein